jgi:hypothetical protein
MIRPATHDDLAGLVAFSLECHADMPWSVHGLSMTMDGVIVTLLDLLESPRADLSIVDLGHGVEGACAVSLGPSMLDRSQTVASEWICHMRPTSSSGLAKRRWVLRMVDHMRTWARDHGAQIFRFNTFFDDATLIRALSRRGITPMETCCVGRL